MITAFLDTNVVIDFYQKRAPFFSQASVIFQLAVEKQIAIVVSTTTIVNCFYLLRKTYDRAELYLKMRALCQLTSIVKTDDNTVQQALFKEWPDFEDCVQYISAVNAEVDYIVTRNISDFVQSEIPVLSTEDFLDAITE